MKRRTQQYGHRYVYNYVSGSQTTTDVEPIPEYLIRLFSKIRSDGFGSDIDTSRLQVIINEYMPGQGIAPHIDDPKKFGDWIICISIGSSLGITFQKYGSSEKKTILVENCSLYQMTGDSRYKWSHGISQVKKEVIDGKENIRQRRISITFRYMK